MKRTLLMLLLVSIVELLYSQTTYYWVGGTATTSFSGNSNWNTALDGSGTSRSSSSATDILIIDGSNVGGSTVETGTVSITVTSTNFGQLILTNNAVVTMQRPAGGGGTGTLTVNGGNGDDFVIGAGCSLSVNSASSDGNVQITFKPGVTGLVSGSFTMMNSGAQRMNIPDAGALVFASGSKFTSNITSSSTSYPFGSSSQSTQYAVIFKAGASLYYEGGYSPMGNSSSFSAIFFEPGSTWYHRATNPSSGSGSFFNNKSFGNIVVQNSATLHCDGPVYRIGDLTIEGGSSFTTHTSGQTAVFGNMVIDGSFSAPGGSSNTLVLGGSTQQIISGSGTIDVPNLTIADNSDIKLNRNIDVSGSALLLGKVDFGTAQIAGTGSFSAKVNSTASGVAGDLVEGSYQITGVQGTLAGLNGLTVTGAGIAPNTSVVGYSSGNALISLSKPIVSDGSGVALTFNSNASTLSTSNPNGFDAATGSVVLAGSQSFEDGVNYIINETTSSPLGISSGSTNSFVEAGFMEINAPVTVNKSVKLNNYLSLNNILTLRPQDTLQIASGATINGNFGPSNYISTTGNSTTGEIGSVQYDGINSMVTIPIGTPNHYLPVKLQPSATGDFTASVFEGITANGMIDGTALNSSDKQTVVDAVWTVKQLNGSGASDISLQWDASLEGSTFTTLTDSDIGIISNDGTSWALPIGTSDNTNNTTTASVNSFGAFSIGAVPQVQPFVFNPIPAKTYGDDDFNGGATSLNTTEPIIYTSDDHSIADIVNGNIHITGTGTVNITASQTGDGTYPAASVTQPLTIEKADLTIKADDLLKYEGLPNPTLTVSYIGFVYNETPAVLLTQPEINTTAVTNSAPGTYPITVSGATAANYDIHFEDGILTVQAKTSQTITFNALATRVYGNPDFPTGASSTNTTIPITYSSSDPNVATVVGDNIHIVGAGTTVITASQVGNDGYFPADDVANTLIVNKAALTIKVRDTTKIEGQPNPDFTITYSGFVSGETSADLQTPPVVSTTATTTSSAGYYTLTPEGAITSNYNITYVNGRLTIEHTDTASQHLQAYLVNNSTLTVRLYSPRPALCDIVIFDMNGKAMLKRNAFMPKGFINVDMDVSSLPSGIYVVTARGDGVKLKKLTPIIKQ